eukprot:6485198-Amphidinium_carterae.1
MNAKSAHHASKVEELLSDVRQQSFCHWHGGQGCFTEALKQRPHCFVAGFPCSPWSAQRPGRFSTSPWMPQTGHQCSVTLAARTTSRGHLTR